MVQWEVLTAMPCNSEYLNADYQEIQASKVACLLDELDGIPIDQHRFTGYHPRVYNRKDIDLDAMVAELCSRLKAIDVTKQSLEMQIWWRDHQEADAKRELAEAALLERERERTKALTKLTERERKILGLN